MRKVKALRLRREAAAAAEVEKQEDPREVSGQEATRRARIRRAAGLPSTLWGTRNRRVMKHQGRFGGMPKKRRDRKRGRR